MGVVVVAAGSGARLGANRPKAFVELGAATILGRALDGVLAANVDEIVVVVPVDLTSQAQELIDARVEEPRRGTVVAGGPARTDSVAAGLAALSSGVRIVLVHDAARCLTPVTVFDRVLAALARGAKGAIPGIEVVDTIKVIDAAGVVVDTPQRARLRAVQTPQGFDREVLRRAHAGGASATDDAALVEALGHDVVVVDGDPRAFKITTPADLAEAQRWLVQEES